MYKSITATRLLFALAFLVLSLGLIGQPKNSRIGDVAMAAPNAAALGKYGDIPVSYYTGVPNISIPLNNLQHGPLSLPLSLSYHASGVKVGELASWVGMGWSLQAGGLISRSVLGLPDETSTWGYYNSAAELDIKKPLVLGEVAVGQRDGEPDLFSINAGNLNAKFYINQDKAPVFIERTDLKIEVYFNYSKFEGFLITDTEGTRYYFGKIPGESVAWEETSYSSSSTRFISSWYLLRIESQDKNYQINFSYKAESYSYRSLSSCEKAITMCDYLGAPQNGGNTTSGTSQSCAGSAVNSRGTYYTRVDIVGLRLSSITAGNTIVTFSANTAREDTDAYYLTSNKSYRLDNVDISSGAGKYCTRYEFSYSYFKDNAVSASEAKRLKLTQLQKRECGTTSPTELPTKFTYNGTVTSGQQFLPERLSKAVDHWGFYNGAGGNNSTQLNIPTSSGIAPNGTNNTYSSTVNRETDEVAMRLGTLERIDYPNGGSTQFSFEANTVNDQVNSSSVSTLGSVLKTSDSSLGAANCGRLSPSKTMNYTFPSGTSAQATYSFTVNSVYFTDGSKCPNAQIEYAKILVYTKVNGIDKVIGEKSFNLDPLHRYKSENLPVSALNLKDGAAYRFVLQSENAWGQFKLTGPTSITTTNVIAKVGGLRVKQIISADGISSSNNITKTYEYKSAADPAKTSGVLYNKPKYVYQMQGLGVAIDNGYAAENSIAALVYTDQSVVPLYSFAGYHIGYTKVREIFTDSRGYA